MLSGDAEAATGLAGRLLSVGNRSLFHRRARVDARFSLGENSQADAWFATIAVAQGGLTPRPDAAMSEQARPFAADASFILAEALKRTLALRLTRSRLNVIVAAGRLQLEVGTSRRGSRPGRAGSLDDRHLYFGDARSVWPDLVVELAAVPGELEAAVRDPSQQSFIYARDVFHTSAVNHGCDFDDR